MCGLRCPLQNQAWVNQDGAITLDWGLSSQLGVFFFNPWGDVLKLEARKCLGGKWRNTFLDSPGFRFPLENMAFPDLAAGPVHIQAQAQEGSRPGNKGITFWDLLQMDRKGTTKRSKGRF